MRRAYEKLLFEYLEYFPCVAIIGPRQCGKTTLLGCLSDPWRIFDLEKQSDHQIVSRDPELFWRLHPAHVAVDEAQLCPDLFGALRVAIDNDRQRPGRFVVTGSSSPDLLQTVSESLAGRVGIIEMAPLAFAETQRDLRPKFFEMLAARASAAEMAEAILPADHLVRAHDYWFRGGYPEPWLKSDRRFHSVWMNQYIGTYLYRDLARLFAGLNETRFRTFLQILAGVSGTVINYSEVARALGVSSPTVRDYFRIAHDTFIWRHVPAFTRDAVKRVVKHPKGYLRDSGLLHYLLRVPTVEDLLAHPAMGRSWEGLVIEEVIRGLNAVGIGFDYFYYRTGGGAEVDLVLEGDFGLVPVEIKYTQAVSPRELNSLKSFVSERGCRLGIVINNDERPRRYDDRIVGIPFSAI